MNNRILVALADRTDVGQLEEVDVRHGEAGAGVP